MRGLHWGHLMLWRHEHIQMYAHILWAKYRTSHAGHVTVTSVTHVPLFPICLALQYVSYKECMLLLSLIPRLFLMAERGWVGA